MVTLDITLLVYAVPVGAALIALLAFFRRRTVRQDANRSRSPMSGIVIGALGLVIGSTLFAAADADRRTYAADAGCRAEFAGIDTSAGVCRLAPMRITKWYWSGGRSSRRHLVLADSDGARFDVTYGHDLRGSVWHGIYDTDDRSATVQLFKRDIVLVETRSGLATTSLLPQARVDRWALVGIVLGCLGVASALRASLWPSVAQTG